MVLTSRRVSSLRADCGTPLVSSSSKCFTQTVPAGKDQLPSRLKPIVPFSLGMENQRDFRALSDQKETFKSYGTTPAFGMRLPVSANTPVSARVDGIAVPTRF